MAYAPKKFSQTKTAREARRRLARQLDGADGDLALWRAVQERVPEAWAWIEEDLDLPERRERITIRLDRSVVQVFRAMGPGYQHAINRVLSTYVQMRIGEVERAKGRVGRVDPPPEARAEEAPSVRERIEMLRERHKGMLGE